MSNRTPGGAFLIQQTLPETVFTNADLSEEQKMMAASTTEFVDKEIWPNKERFEQKDYALTEAIMRKAGELGLLGVAVPEAYGGLGMGFVSTMLVCDLISGATGSVATAFGAHTGIGTLPILLYGSEALKKKYLPKLASGTWFGAYCLTEPDAGSDANSGKSKAVLSDDGKYYEITGQKMWISNAGFAKLFIVFARIEDDKNITGFVVEYDPDKPNGITLGEEEHKLGIRASSTRQVFFNRTKVPVDHLLGVRNGGFKIAMNALNAGRIKLAAACLNAQRRVIDNAIHYANERRQFGQPIASFGAIQHKLAEMATRYYVSETACYRAAHDIEVGIKDLKAAGKTQAEAELKGFEEYAVECSILKVYASEAMQDCSDEGMQIYGGMGFSEDTPMATAWRDARISRIYEGTNEINRLLTVGMLVRRAMKGQLDLMGPAMKVAEELMGIPSFETPDYSALLSEEFALVDKMKKAVLMTAGKAVEKFGTELEKQQQVLLDIADMIIETYMAESTLLATSKRVAQQGEDKLQTHIHMAKLNLYNALEKLGKCGREAIISFTEGDEQKMLLMGLKRFTKYTHFPNPVALRRAIAADLIQHNGLTF